YRPAVNEGEQPGARLRALGDEAVGCAPRAEEGLLHGVLRQGVVAENAEGEPVGESAEAAGELGERLIVGAGDQREQRLVRQMRELPGSGFRSPSAGAAQGDDPSLSPVAHGATRRPPSPSGVAWSSARKRRPVARA